MGFAALIEQRNRLPEVKIKFRLVAIRTHGFVEETDNEQETCQLVKYFSCLCLLLFFHKPVCVADT
jgi:hypothetical protein